MTIKEIQAKIKEIQQKLLELLKSHNHLSMKGENIYIAASNSLGKHMTLNEAIPAEVGCAEAVSAVLSLVGIYDGPKGIAGTASLYEWLVASPLFEKADVPQEGDIILSPTGMGNGTIQGHVGICGMFGKQVANDWGIMSNDSATGKFLERWSWMRWNAYYGKAGGLPVYLFRAK